MYTEYNPLSILLTYIYMYVILFAGVVDSNPY